MRKLSLLALIAISLPLFAFDVKRKQDALDAKARAFPTLTANYDAARVSAYLSDPIWASWNQAHGGNWTAQFDTLTGHARRVFGGAIPWTTPASTNADVERVARDFIANNSSILGVSNARLRFVNEAATPTTDGRIRYAAFDYVIDGVPVEAARLVFAINSGNMIYWHSSNIADVSVTTSPSIAASQALANVLAYAGITSAQASVIEPPMLKLMPRNGAAGALLKYQLTYETTFKIAGSNATYGAYIDALTGSVISFGDANEYATSCPARSVTPGRVTGGIRPAQATDAEVVRSFPFASIEGASATTMNGGFNFAGATASTGLNGRFFDTNCVDCVKSDSDPQSGFQPFVSSADGRLNLGTGGHDVTHGPGQPTISYGNGLSTPADRTAFFHTNIARMIALKWLDLPWLREATIPVKVNINDVCNAFWDGSSLNFFKSGQYDLGGGEILDCKNTGEIRDVMQHEWGHGLDANDGRPVGLAMGLGDLATGEAVGDHVALFVDHDSCIGQSFFNETSGPFVTDPDTNAIRTCDGVRNLDELRASHGTMTTTNVTTKCGGPPLSTSSPTVIVYVGPLLNEGHCEGEIWGQTDWHLVNDLLTGRKYGTVTLDANKQFPTYSGDAIPAASDGSPNPGFDKDAAWTLLERLYFDSRPMVASYAPSRYQAIGPSAYDSYMVVDDEGDGLANGTPHAAYINDAYVHHGIEEWGVPGGVPAAVDSKNCDGPASPAVSLAQSIDSATGTPAVIVSWTPVAGAASYSVLRNERRNDVFLEVARTNGASAIDAGVDNGVTYNYRVQAISGSSCWAASGGSVQSIRVAQPDPWTNSVSVTDSPGGNGDGHLDAGERASLFITIKNGGLAGLTNVAATLSSMTSGVTVTSTTARTYGTIAAGSTAGPKQSFNVSVSPDGDLCGVIAFLVVNVSSDQGCFALPVEVTIGTNCSVYKSAYAQASSLAITSDRLAPTCGDGDNVPDPGESVRVTVNVNNLGTRNASGVTVKLTSNKSYLTIPSDTISVGALAANGAETKSVNFTVNVGRTVPFGDVATFTAIVTSSGQSQIATRTLDTVVNRDKVMRTLSYDFETGAQGWTSSDPLGWTMTNLAPTTGDLTNLWHEQYAKNRCDYLVSPAFEFSPSSAVAFDLAYISENSDAPYDGLDVQVSIDGGRTWTTINVTQGYSQLSAGTGCMTKDQPFFSGVSPLMQRYDADLSAYAGLVGQVRFRFSSDDLVDATAAGAWIDNVTASNVVVSTPSIPCP